MTPTTDELIEQLKNHERNTGLSGVTWRNRLQGRLDVLEEWKSDKDYFVYQGSVDDEIKKIKEALK